MTYPLYFPLVIYIWRETKHIPVKLLLAICKKYLLYVKISELIYMIKSCKACHVNLH